MKNFPLTAESFGAQSGISRVTLKEQLANKLIYMIKAGLILEGDELPSERDLSSTLDVSRETVRGAFHLLSEQGLIEVARGARTRVVGGDFSNSSLLENGITKYDLSTVTDAREAIEVAILRSAATNITSRELKRLSDLIKDQQLMFDDPVAFYISDQEFHEIIYKAGRNAFLEDIATDVYAYSQIARQAATREDYVVEVSVREHVNIYNALERNDPDAAEKAILTHLGSIYKTTVKALQARTGNWVAS